MVQKSYCNKWTSKRTGEEKMNFCTGVDCILIDDLQKNISDWEALGGIGILYTSAESTLEKLLCATSEE